MLVLHHAAQDEMHAGGEDDDAGEERRGGGGDRDRGELCACVRSTDGPRPNNGAAPNNGIMHAAAAAAGSGGYQPRTPWAPRRTVGVPSRRVPSRPGGLSGRAGQEEGKGPTYY